MGFGSDFFIFFIQENRKTTTYVQKLIMRNAAVHFCTVYQSEQDLTSYIISWKIRRLC